MAGPIEGTLSFSDLHISGNILSGKFSTTPEPKNPEITFYSDSSYTTQIGSITKSGYYNNPVDFSATLSSLPTTVYASGMWQDAADTGQSAAGSANFQLPSAGASRIVQLKDKDGNYVYPIGADPNTHPIWFTMTWDETITDSAREYTSPKGNRYYIVGVSENQTIQKITSTDYDLSKVNVFRQTFCGTQSSAFATTLGLSRLSPDQYCYTRYMGQLYKGTAKGMHETNVTASSALEAQGVIDWTPTTDTKRCVNIEAECTKQYESDGRSKWMLSGFFSVLGENGAGSFTIEAVTPIGELPLFYFTSARPGNMEAWNRTISILEE